ncbi:1130_t:CDS:2 [Gigaspora margarita]|uniref:1130_t:CDS:1 n=1 Tax=Gigaspora margarita TaxID=4874 RepID=A0ABN7W829_GIGMA|nr:1130_t:CDS:2 [Gigaspora margarita]
MPIVYTVTPHFLVFSNTQQSFQTFSPLLVYEVRSKTFYHYDTLRGANYEHAKPLVKELLQQIHQTNSPNLDKSLIKRHDIRQGNGWDCGVAVIAIMRRIIELSTDNS